MFDHHELIASLRALDADALLRTVKSEDLCTSEQATRFITIIRESGNLLEKFPNAEREAKRSKFIAACRQVLQNTDEGVVADFTAHVEDAQIAERGFRAIRSAMRQAPIWQLSAQAQAWAMLHRSGPEVGHVLSEIDKEIERQVAGNKGPFDPKQLRLKSVDGSLITPDVATHSVVQSTSTTLLLLAHENGWFDRRSGAVLLPAETDDDLTANAQAFAHTVLSLQWRRLERAWDRSRLFRKRLRLEQQALSVGEIQRDSATLLMDDPPGAASVHDKIAQDRLEHIFFQHQMSFESRGVRPGLIRPTGPDAPPLAPGAFISVEELVTADLLDLGFCLPFDDSTQLFGGLSLRAWLRGYAYLALIAKPEREKLGGGLLKFSEGELVSHLKSAGLSSDEAARFIKLTTLQRHAIDLYDTPLIRTTENQLYFYAVAYYSPLLGNILLSRIGSLKRHNEGREGEVETPAFEGKGKRFEQRTLQLFRDAKLNARSFRYSIDGVSYDCDVAVLIDKVLFIFECKNYNLPLGRASALYYYQFDLRDFKKQARRIASDLATHPQLIQQHFGANVEVDRIVPCVLQALPWSEGIQDGVYFYDASALSRFLREGSSSVRTFGGDGFGLEFPSRARKGKAPTADELLSEMADPKQLRMGRLGWEFDRKLVEIDDGLWIATGELSRRALTQEEQLIAMGHSATEASNILRQMSMRSSSLLTQAIAANARTSVPTTLPGRNDPCFCGSNKKFKRCCGQRG